jgi:hypothetical protein
MEPSNLALEIFNQVLACETARDRKTRLRTLCRYSLVSRRWHTILAPLIYSRYLHDGEIHSILSLWKFLRSILCNKQIAHQVRELNIRNWTFGLVFKHGRLDLSEGDLDLARTAARMAGLETLETSILEGLRKADPRPLMALLITSLPNLTTLYAQLPETDIFLGQVLRKAVETQQDGSDGHPLCNLREAHFASSWNYRAKTNHFSLSQELEDNLDRRARRDDSDDDDHRAYHLKLDHLWPIFHLPKIQKLSLFDLDTTAAAMVFRNSSKTSSITDLTLVYRASSEIRPADTSALLAVPKSLTKLSIYLEDFRGWEIYSGVCNQLSNADLWAAIRQHEDSLEYLDVYRDCTSSLNVYITHSVHNSHFGLMQMFRNLRDIHIQPGVLVGGCCTEEMAPFDLKDTLPPQVESITFYADAGLVKMENFDSQVQEAISSTTFRNLGCVALEETDDPRYDYIYMYGQRRPARDYSEVKQTCSNNGKNFKEVPPEHCSKGGSGRRYYRYAIRKRRVMGERFENIRSAVGHWLQEKHTHSHLDGDPPDGHPHDLSIEDLDSYELPWDALARPRGVDENEFIHPSEVDLDKLSLGSDEEDGDDGEDSTEQTSKYRAFLEELRSRVEDYDDWDDV